jgi:hypothetical protein
MKTATKTPAKSPGKSPYRPSPKGPSGKRNKSSKVADNLFWSQGRRALSVSGMLIGLAVLAYLVTRAFTG